MNGRWIFPLCFEHGQCREIVLSTSAFMFGPLRRATLVGVREMGHFTEKLLHGMEK